jgi:hypothetical protein
LGLPTPNPTGIVGFLNGTVHSASLKRCLSWIATIKLIFQGSQASSEQLLAFRRIQTIEGRPVFAQLLHALIQGTLNLLG